MIISYDPRGESDDRQIWSATSDCGRVRYSPIGNNALSIDGRAVYQGHYCAADTGMMTADRPEPEICAVAVALMHEVDAHNSAWLDRARERMHARLDERDARFDAWRSRVPAHLTDDDL